MDAYEFITNNGSRFFDFNTVEPDDDLDKSRTVSFQIPRYVFESIREDVGERGDYSAAVQDLIMETLGSEEWSDWLEKKTCSRQSVVNTSVSLEESTIFRLRVEASRLGIGVSKLIRILLISHFGDEQ